MGLHMIPTGVHWCYKVMDGSGDVCSRVLRRADQALSESGPSHATPVPTVRRILREINEFRRNPHADIQIFPSEER